MPKPENFFTSWRNFVPGLLLSLKKKSRQASLKARNWLKSMLTVAKPVESYSRLRFQLLASFALNYRRPKKPSLRPVNSSLIVITSYSIHYTKLYETK